MSYNVFLISDFIFLSHLTVKNMLVLIHVGSYDDLTVSSASPRTRSGSGCHLADTCLVTPGCLIYWAEVAVIILKIKRWIGEIIKLNIMYFIFHICLKCKSVEIPCSQLCRTRWHAHQHRNATRALVMMGFWQKCSGRWQKAQFGLFNVFHFSPNYACIFFSSLNYLWSYVYSSHHPHHFWVTSIYCYYFHYWS